MFKQSQSGAGILKASCCSFYIEMLKRIDLMLLQDRINEFMS